MTETTDQYSDRFESRLTEFVPMGRSGLLPALLAAQAEYGFISEAVAGLIGRALKIPLSQVYGVIEFYSQLSTEPGEQSPIQICDGPVCAAAGDWMLAFTQSYLETHPNGSKRYQVERVPCLGLCNHAPALLLGDSAIGRAQPEQVPEILSRRVNGKGDLLEDYVAGSLSILTANSRHARTTDLDQYLAGGGYIALKAALLMDPSTVIAEIKSSGLVGRGGAAFPAGIKWEAVAAAPGDKKYVVCNADESEPGTFKDRILMERDPHRLVEAMIVAGYATGANEGYIYIRGEYPQAFNAVEHAVQEARQAGFLGQNILSSGLDFSIELRRGAGAYICGEETALFESIEGKRGFPRIKPPFPTTHGLFGLPTLINNVETLCNVPYILTNGASAYRKIGTAQSPGPKLFCVSGDVARPGLFEVPFGISLRELVYEWAGGIPDGKQLAAVLLGGAAGTFAGENELDVSLTFEDLRTAGLALGSGAVMVFDQRRDLREILRRVAGFFAEESCGKCYPCQMGTRRQLEVLTQIAAGQVKAGDMQRLQDVGWTMTDASLCGLGQTAATAVLSALERWPDLQFSYGR